MADEDLRELERRFKETGSGSHQAAFLRAAKRAGTLDSHSQAVLRAAALLGDPVAIEATALEPVPPEYFAALIEVLPDDELLGAVVHDLSSLSGALASEPGWDDDVPGACAKDLLPEKLPWRSLGRETLSEVKQELLETTRDGGPLTGSAALTYDYVQVLMALDRIDLESATKGTQDDRDLLAQYLFLSEYARLAQHLRVETPSNEERLARIGNYLLGRCTAAALA